MTPHIIFYFQHFELMNLTPEMQMSIPDFKIYICELYGNRKKHIVRKSHMAARYGFAHPEAFSQIGIMFISEKEVLINFDTFAQYIGSKRNTVQKDLRLSGFKTTRTTKETKNKIARQFPMLAPALQQFKRSLSIIDRSDPYFQINSSEEDISKIRSRSKKENLDNENNSNATPPEINEPNGNIQPHNFVDVDPFSFLFSQD